MATGLIKSFPAFPSSRLTLCYISGYRSTCATSLKAHCVQNYAKQHGYGYMAWDHRPDASVQAWFDESYALLTQGEEGEDPPAMILVGASMGTWLALLLAKAQPRRIKGIIGVGGAVNVTEKWLRQDSPSPDDPTLIWPRPSRYAPEGYYMISNAMLIQSRKALWNPNDTVSCPVRLIHGADDPDAPLADAIKLAQDLSGAAADCTLHVIPDGDHRLSRPEDLAVLEKQLDNIISEIPVDKR
ncbi:Alpha/Beta hydrolase protein [Dichotomocladium elegans]|nr:Alpha/Beta hydrolase protein [Dichotomocladium elegans]